jgi:hypothetical protein
LAINRYCTSVTSRSILDERNRLIASVPFFFGSNSGATLGDMSESSDPWQEYRKRRNLALFAFLGYMPVVFMFAVVTMRLFHSETPAYVAAFSWMAFYAFTSLRFQSFRCPRCHKWFFIRWWPPPPPWPKRCVHCGLPKYAPVSPEHTDVRFQKP